MMACPVSVIVPAYNAGNCLGKCLKGLLAQIPSAKEIIVVDDHSSDDTARIALDMGVDVVRVPQNSGPSHARNLGSERASGEIIFFVDADVVLMPGAVERVADLFSKDSELAAVFGSYDAVLETSGIVSRYRNLLHHYTHQHGKSKAETFWAGCGAVRREVFLAFGGFDEECFPRCIEDIEFGYRLTMAGRFILLDKALQCTHLKQWSFWSMVKTDIFCRAIPWIRLQLGRSRAYQDLNIKLSQRLSLVLLGLCFFCLAWACFGTSPLEWFLLPCCWALSC